MVGRWAAALIVFGVTASAAVAAPQSFAVATVLVQHDGKFQADPVGRQTPAQCARFHLSSPAALRWFRSAREVSEHEWLESLDWTQCGADGSLVTGDGHTYRWILDQSGRGRIVITPTVSVFLAGPELPF